MYIITLQSGDKLIFFVKIHIDVLLVLKYFGIIREKTSGIRLGGNIALFYIIRLPIYSNYFYYLNL